MTRAELRVRVRALAVPFSGRLEQVADEISARSSDPEVRLAMVRFKGNGIPEMQAALFRPDPVAALIDAWTFLAQLDDLVERLQAGNTGLRDLDIARREFGAMEDDLQSLWRMVTGRPGIEAKRRIHRWAAEHRIGSVPTRQSTEALIAHLTTTEGISLVGAAAELTETSRDMVDRLNVMSTSLPKQARWQAESFTREMLRDPTLLGGHADGETPASVAGGLTALVSEAPETIERGATMAFGALRRERIETLAFAREEREAVLAAIEQERRETMTEMNAMGDRWIEKSYVRAQSLLYRAILLQLVVVVVSLFGVFLVLRSAGFRRRGPSKSS